MRTNRQKHCSLWLCHAIGVLIHGLTDKFDTVVEFDSDRCFFYCDCLTSGNSACLSTAAAMLSYSHEITSKNDYSSLFFGTPDLFNISYSRELYLFSKFLHFEEIVRVKMAVCFEMIVSET